MDRALLDRFEDILQEGLHKICNSSSLLPLGTIPSSEDIERKWNEEYARAYTADAVENFNEYPDAALAWAAYLGMAVAHNWDLDWQSHCNDSYESYYGPNGYDDMDEHIAGDVLTLDEDTLSRVRETLLSCAYATRTLIRHEGIELQTATGFYVLVRAYTVMFRLGAAIELVRLGYKMVGLKPSVVS